MTCFAMSSAPPAPAVGASTGARGLRALAPALQRVRWPDKFKPATPPRYSGATDPLAFLLAYEEAILEAGGDGRVMANWLPMALGRSARMAAPPAGSLRGPLGRALPPLPRPPCYTNTPGRR